MPDRTHVTVHPPLSKGGRPVTAHAHGVDERLGVATGVGDVVEFLRRIGLEDGAELIDREDSRITWIGGGAADWA
ncbi:hypothetical protein AB0P12_16360 [Streptomyces subrutilus]|uniref:hypothetical protein n=1 Tax=Streptomyces subrutilus TaxID=36818 RepID=UPI0034168F98